MENSKAEYYLWLTQDVDRGSMREPSTRSFVLGNPESEEEGRAVVRFLRNNGHTARLERSVWQDSEEIEGPDVVEIMTWDEALSALAEGKAVRRAAWGDGGCYLTAVPNPDGRFSVNSQRFDVISHWSEEHPDITREQRGVKAHRVATDWKVVH